jgi:predicted CXXCH cytochrome family protein
VRRHRRLAGILFGLPALMIYFARVPPVDSPDAVSAQRTPSEEAGYIAPGICAGCHREIAKTYGQTGMARSFSLLSSSVNLVEGTYYHKPSDSYFTMLRRDGKYYQRRYQMDFAGKPVNVMEKQVDFIMGSGNHARAYLHRTARGTLTELPLGWYAEKGGYWAMNPGYDRPDHDGFRRPISYDCMFCHNGYPKIPEGHDQPFAEPVYMAPLPEGIDCQRCHGPGAKHVRVAKTAGATLKDLRASIVNPSRLSAQLQMEACMVCHLETTSFPLPNAIQRYERGPFSYKPGEPMSAFILNFDHAPGTGHDDKFEIVNAAYRLRRSACFLKSSGQLLCTTCHNPHEVPRGEEAARHYTAVCRQCHAATFDRQVEAGRHTRSVDCVGCHMPKRRTEDVVHVVVTDHYIQRRKPAGDLLAEMAERHETGDAAYRGPVVLYYPERLPPGPENDLYLAIAQVNQKSNLKDGVAQLSAAIERHRPERAEYYFELAEAWRDTGQLAKALRLYREAVRRNPKFVVGLQHLGTALRRSGQLEESAESLKQAASVAPENASMWQELGLTYRAQGRKGDAIAALEKAIELDPDMAEAHNNLGIIRVAEGEGARAESAFREAIRIQPNYADSHGNLGALLSGTGDLAEAQYHFEIAVRLRPDDATTRYNYAMVLGRNRRFDDAQRELEASLEADPGLADAHELLADLLMAKGQAGLAIPHYREAVRIQPELGRANLGLGAALVAMGDVDGAVPYLRKAAADKDAEVREEATRVLRSIGKER